MRISDWSSDVCSSDLPLSFGGYFANRRQNKAPDITRRSIKSRSIASCLASPAQIPFKNVGVEDAFRQYLPVFVQQYRKDRKSVVSGKRVSVRVDLGGRRIIKIK